jgi:hypothetical protein
VNQLMNSRGGVQNYKAAANRFRKIATVPREQNPVIPSHERAKRPSNASFETKHRLPAMFRGSPSWHEASRSEPDFARRKSRAQVALSAATGALRAHTADLHRKAGLLCFAREE